MWKTVLEVTSFETPEADSVSRPGCTWWKHHYWVHFCDKAQKDTTLSFQFMMKGYLLFTQLAEIWPSSHSFDTDVCCCVFLRPQILFLKNTNSLGWINSLSQSHWGSGGGPAHPRWAASQSVQSPLRGQPESKRGKVPFFKAASWQWGF